MDEHAKNVTQRRYGMVWYGMVWYGMVYMVWYGIYGMVWYGMVWYGFRINVCFWPPTPPQA